MSLRIFACALALAIAPAVVLAQATVTVQRGESASPVDVPVNRGIVVEVSEPFVELSIANPNIADISTLSDRTAYVLGKSRGPDLTHGHWRGGPADQQRRGQGLARYS